MEIYNNSLVDLAYSLRRVPEPVGGRQVLIYIRLDNHKYMLGEYIYIWYICVVYIGQYSW